MFAAAYAIEPRGCSLLWMGFLQKKKPSPMTMNQYDNRGARWPLGLNKLKQCLPPPPCDRVDSVVHTCCR